jgi:hypothetical protein
MVKSKGTKKSSKGKKAVSKLLKDVKDDVCFCVIDGSTVKNIIELVDTLDRMSDDSYYYHVTNDKNDFSNWIREVFKEETLANEIAKIHNRLETEVAILRYLIKGLI